MNKGNIIVSLERITDLKKINASTHYLNLNITKPDNHIIDFLIENGNHYSFSDLIDNKKGYIYVDYPLFLKAETIINDIINAMPENLNNLEISKYLYIKLGKILSYDINAIPEKNDNFNFSMINTINNPWGALASGKATNISFCKCYLYLCSKLNIPCEIIMTSDNGYLCNKIEIDNKKLIVDLTKDIPFITAGFKTRFFDTYNNDLTIDKKIGYTNIYSEDQIDKVLKKIDYTKEDAIYDILTRTQDIINAKDIKPIELGVIYNLIFNKY